MAALRSGCALAIALTAIAQAPQAQASGFQGTGTVVPGSGSASIFSGTTNDTITVDTSEVVIDWTPTDTGGTGSIDFLPAPNSVLYTDNSSAGLTGYTVLNRILPVDGSGNPVTGRPVAFNGTVTTQLGANNFPVGNVWFYSPGGIIAGPTAVFDVGGLVLTTSDIDFTGGLFGSGGEIRFAGTPNSASSVEIQAGAQINVVNPGSYVALVAPRVVQGGTVEVNGSVAYVGAEAATLRINGGLFDISIGTGTGDTNGVVHTGATNLTPDAGTQRAFMAAVPKNTALTMLLTGDVGYSTAAVASVQDTAVILSAGHDIGFGQSLGTPNSSSTAAADISIGNSSFLPAVDGRASGSITINPTSLGTISFGQNATFAAATAITVGADNGETISANADFLLKAGTSGTGGTITLYADGIPFSTPAEGQVSVAGTLTLDTSAFGLDDFFTAGATGGSATGGTSEIRANGGSISAGSIFLQSTAQSGYGSAAAGTATGGTARISLTSVNGGGSITSAGNVSIDVSASGPFFSAFGPPAIGAVATGGTVQVSTDGGTLGFAALNINASAQGGEAASGGTAGQATGGDIRISTRTSGTGLGLFTLTDCTSFGCNISADAIGGAGLDGADGTGGTIRMTAQDGLFATDASFSISADGYGGAESTGGTTGSGFGGDVLLEILPGAVNNGAMSFGDLMVSADGFGLPIPGDYSGSGNGGLGQGGSVRFDLITGALSATSVTMSASGLGGPAGASSGSTPFVAGDGRGGQAVFNLAGGFGDVGTLALTSFGQGGINEPPSLPTDLLGTVGNGIGGTSRFIAGSGTMTIGDLFVHASGLGGESTSVFDANSNSAGNGTGGTAEFSFTTATLDVTSLELFAHGTGGEGGSNFSSTGTGNAGAGGDGTGGTARMTLGPGNLTLTGFSIAANGTGGAGGDNQGTGNAGSGGDGFGGAAILNGTDAEYAFAAVTLQAIGVGGPSGTAVTGLPGSVGNGAGGLARMTNADTAASMLGRSVDSLTLDVSGTGTSILSGRAEISDTASFTGGGLVINGNLDVLGMGPAASPTSGFYYTGAGDGTRVGGDATIAVGGHSRFDLDGGGIFDVAGALQISGGQNILVRHINQSTTPTPSIRAGTIGFSNFGFIDADAGSLISSSGAMDLTSLGGFIDTDRLNSGGTTVLNAASGTVTVATDLQSAGLVQASGQSVDIRSLGALDVTLATASAGNLRIIADNGLSLATGAASGTITLGSTLGDISVTDLTGASVDIGTFGTASFAGLTQGQGVQVNSGDIIIGAGAQLGVAGTTTVLTLANSRTANPTFIGGAGSTTGYSLSAAELTRLFADSIAINGTFGGTGEPDVVVDSFTMTSRAGTPGGNLGPNGSLSIVSSGDIQVIGDVALTGLGSGNQLFLIAQGAAGTAAIEVDAANASIALSDANGALAGQVNFEADDVFIATSTAIADVRAAADTNAITARLSLNDGVVRNGVVSASTIFADVGGGLYIQNTAASSAFADRRGFAALTDTLDIATRSANTRIVVNGVLVDAVAGTTITGLDVLPLVRINGVVGASSGSFDPRSTVNGCLIASPLLCTVNVEELPNLPPPHNNIEEPLVVGEGGTGSDLFPAMIVEIKDFVPFGYPPLIDEPVTGAGNDDLWMPPCGDKAGSGCAAP